MGVSQHSTVSLEDIADAAPGTPLWFQLYILKDRALTADIVRRWVGIHLVSHLCLFLHDSNILVDDLDHPLYRLERLLSHVNNAAKLRSLQWTYLNKRIRKISTL